MMEKEAPREPERGKVREMNIMGGGQIKRRSKRTAGIMLLDWFTELHRLTPILYTHSSSFFTNNAIKLD